MFSLALNLSSNALLLYEEQFNNVGLNMASQCLKMVANKNSNSHTHMVAKVKVFSRRNNPNDLNGMDDRVHWTSEDSLKDRVVPENKEEFVPLEHRP